MTVIVEAKFYLYIKGVETEDPSGLTYDLSENQKDDIADIVGQSFLQAQEIYYKGGEKKPAKVYIELDEIESIEQE